MFLVLYITVCPSVASTAEEYYEDLENIEDRDNLIQQYGEDNVTVAIRPNS